MASQLSGISREAFTLVRRNVVTLIIATILPVLLMSGFGAANIVLSLNEALDLQARGLSSAPQGTSVVNLLRFFAFGLAGLFLYCWMVAKVSKLCLTGETATIIGSGGTLRAGLWILLYYFGAALVLFIPILVVVILSSLFDISFGNAVAALGAGRLLVTLAAILVVALCFGWAQCRFIVGFPPLAIGEKPGLFDGWALSRGCSFGLFGRVLVALVVLMVGMIAVLEILGWILPLLLSGEALSRAAEGGGASAALLATVLAPQLLTLMLSVPVYWYLIVLFCVAYQRLSAPQTV